MNMSCYEWNDRIMILDKVTLLGNDQNSSASITWWANAAGTIPYEVLVHLDRGIRREIVL